jgi:hypothetical protein
MTGIHPELDLPQMGQKVRDDWETTFRLFSLSSVTVYYLSANTIILTECGVIEGVLGSISPVTADYLRCRSTGSTFWKETGK